MRGGTSSLSTARYKPLPQEPSSSSFHLSSSSAHGNAFEVGGLDELEDEEKGNEDIALSNLDLQNRRQRVRLGGSYSPQTPTIYEDSEFRDSNGHSDSATESREEMSYNASDSQTDSGNAYSGGGMRGVAEDYAYGGYGGSGSSGNVGAPAKEGRRGDRIAMYVALAALGTFLIGSLLIVLTNNPSQLGLFAGHPPLQALAITCFGIGILTLQPTSQPKTKARGLTRHQLIILGIGFPSIIVGTVLIYANKTINEFPHFKSWHATFGLISVVWMVGQILLGGLSVWFGGRAFGGGMKAKSVWKYHRVSGYLLFPMFLMTAAVGGNYSSWVAGNVNVGVRIFIYTLAPIFAIVAIWSRARLSKMNFRPS